MNLPVEWYRINDDYYLIPTKVASGVITKHILEQYAVAIIKMDMGWFNDRKWRIICPFKSDFFPYPSDAKEIVEKFFNLIQKD